MTDNFLLGARTEPEVLAEVKQLFDLESFKYDATVLPAYLRAAVSSVGHHLGGPMVQRAVTETVVGGSDGRLVLSSWPIVAVTSVTGGDGTVLSGPVVDQALGVLTWAYGGQRATPGRSYTVVYTAGYTDVPDDVWLAVVEMVRHLFRNFRSARPGDRQPGTPATAGRAGMPPVVTTLLEPHHVPGIA